MEWRKCGCGAWHVGDTRSSCIVYSAADVIWMSVVCGMSGVGGVGGVGRVGGVGGACVFVSGRRLRRGGEWMRGLGLGCSGVGGIGLEWVWELGPGSREVGWCYVCVSCESGLFV